MYAVLERYTTVQSSLYLKLRTTAAIRIGGITPSVLNVAIRWRGVVSFTPLPLYRRRKEILPWSGGWMGSRSGLDAWSYGESQPDSFVFQSQPSHCTDWTTTSFLSVLPSFISIQIPCVKSSVFFNDAVRCLVYTASVTDKWVRIKGGMIPTGENRSTQRETWPTVTLSTLPQIPHGLACDRTGKCKYSLRNVRGKFAPVLN
jgi:hypothetical protein